MQPPSASRRPSRHRRSIPRRPSLKALERDPRGPFRTPQLRGSPARTRWPRGEECKSNASDVCALHENSITTAADVAHLWILEPDTPMRAIAERLVLRPAAAAQRVVLLGSALAAPHARELDPAGHRVGSVVHDRDRRLASRRRRLYPAH